jgi:hypothetical protein
MQEYRGEFEVHVTVGLPEQDGWGSFHSWCTLHHCKSVHIILASGEHAEQPMATWRRSGATLPAVLSEARQIAAELQNDGFPPVRIKVEASTLNQNVPQSDEEAIGHATSNYFEHHVKLLRNRAAPCDGLMRACGKRFAHLSRNAWRERSQGKEERFVTLRSHRVGKGSSDRQLRELLDLLNAIGEQVIEVESEYCVYDSNLDLDRGWLPSEMPSHRGSW